MQTIKELQAKALSLFSKYGVRSVNMNDLAFHMGVSKRTLYQMFSSKEELIQGLFEAIREDWEASIEKILIMPGHSAERVIAFYQLRYDYTLKLSPTFLQQSSKYYTSIHAYLREVRLRIKDVHRQLLTDAIDAGIIRKVFQPELIVTSHELLLDFIVERLNVPHPDRTRLCQHLIFSEMAGIIDPDNYDVEQDLVRLMK